MMNVPNNSLEREMNAVSLCPQPNNLAPKFTAESYDNVNKTIGTIKLEDYRGKWVVLFFYPSNFTFV
jgi:alkyl hydroperoxide reductase subunit AhpC